MNDVKNIMKRCWFGAQLKHTFLNSSQSHPISVKLEKSGEFHHFIVFDAREFFFLFNQHERSIENGKQSEHICWAAMERRSGRILNNKIKRFHEHFMCEILIVLLFNGRFVYVPPHILHIGVRTLNVVVQASSFTRRSLFAYRIIIDVCTRYFRRNSFVMIK